GRQGGPHRARQVGLQGDPAVRGAGAFHAGGLRPYRRRGQSAAQQEVPTLAERDAEESADPRRVEGGRSGGSRFVVERLGQVAVGAVGPQGAGARAGARRPARARGGAGQLRQGENKRLGFAGSFHSPGAVQRVPAPKSETRKCGQFLVERNCMTKRYRYLSEAQKRSAVARVAGGEAVSTVARSIGVNRNR